MTSGIYTIRCVPNDTYYVGQSRNVLSRFRDHRKALNSGRHHNRRLQACWIKYGSEAFEFNLEMPCEEEELSAREQMVAEAFRDAEEKLFNLSEDFSKPASGVARPDNAERLRALHADPRSGIRDGVTKYLAKIKGTQEARERATKASRSRSSYPAKPKMLLTPEQRQQVRVAAASRLAERRAQEGITAPGKSVILVDENTIYPTARKAAEANGVSPALLCYHLKRTGVCRGKRYAYANNNDSSVRGIKR